MKGLHGIGKSADCCYQRSLDGAKPVDREIESRYITSANRTPRQVQSTGCEFLTREEIYGVLIDLINNQSLRLRDSKISQF